ncbi:MAG: endolytic transglycosylase MltG, partial [Acidimicrobiales bacterium]
MISVVVVGGYLWLNSEANPAGPVGAQVVVSVRKGTGVDQFAGTLQHDGVIGSSFAFRIWVRLHGIPTMLSGTYAFNKHESYTTVKNLLAGGPNVFELQVPPGFTVSELAARVGQFPGHTTRTFEALATGGSIHSPWQPAGGSNLDGLLGTGTYQILPGETDTQLLTQMIDRFDRQANAMQLPSRAAALGLTPYQAITVASIAEKEGVIPKNLGPVVRVILNRLHQGMPLQMDSTVLYAEGRDGGPVTSKDESLRTPYNTYLNKGLTPTPICFPAPAALHAALYPPAGSWLYIQLVKPDGTEAFSNTFAAQLANEALAA